MGSGGDERWVDKVAPLLFAYGDRLALQLSHSSSSYYYYYYYYYYHYRCRGAAYVFTREGPYFSPRSSQAGGSD